MTNQVTKHVRRLWPFVIHAAKGPSQAFSIEGGVFGWCGQVEMTADQLLAGSDGSTHQDVLDLYVPDEGVLITASALVESLGMKPDTARQRLHRMFKSGQLDKVAHGEYKPKSDARNAVTLSQSHEKVTELTNVTGLGPVTSTGSESEQPFE